MALAAAGGASLGGAWRLLGVPGANGLGTDGLAEALPPAWAMAGMALAGALTLAGVLAAVGKAWRVTSENCRRAVACMGAPLLLAWLPGLVGGLPGLPPRGIWVTQWDLLLVASGLTAALSLLLWRSPTRGAEAARALLTDSGRGRALLFGLVVLLAAGVRLVCAPPMLHDGNPLFDPAYFHNDDRNDNLVQGGQILTNGLAGKGWFPDKVFEHGPLYVYFVTVITALSHNVLLTSYIVQLILGSLAAGVTFLAADRLIGRRGALVAGVLAAFYAPAIYYETLLIADSITPLVFALLLWTAACHEPARGRLRWWGGAVVIGILVGCAAMLRPNLALTGVGLAAWLVAARWQERPLWRRIATVALIAVVALAVTAPVSAWVTGKMNRSTFGEWAAQWAHDLAQGKWRSPCFVLPPGRVIWKFAWATDAQPYFYSPTSEEMFGLFSPGGWWLALRKVHLLWAWFDSPDLCNFHLYSRLSAPLYANPVTMRLLSPLALVGIAAGLRRFRQLSLLYSVLVTVALAQVLFYISGRYRAALAPTLYIFAGLGATALARATVTLRAAWHDRAFGNTKRAAGAWALLVAAALWVNLYDPAGNHSMWHSDAMFGNFLRSTAQRAVQRKDYTAAVGAADRILWVANPDYQMLGYGAKAELANAQGRTDETRRYAQQAKAIEAQRMKEPVLDKNGGRHFPPTSDWVQSWNPR